MVWIWINFHTKIHSNLSNDSCTNHFSDLRLFDCVSCGQRYPLVTSLNMDGFEIFVKILVKGILLGKGQPMRKLYISNGTFQGHKGND